MNEKIYLSAAIVRKKSRERIERSEHNIHRVDYDEEYMGSWRIFGWARIIFIELFETFSLSETLNFKNQIESTCDILDLTIFFDILFHNRFPFESPADFGRASLS